MGSSQLVNIHLIKVVRRNWNHWQCAQYKSSWGGHFLQIVKYCFRTVFCSLMFMHTTSWWRQQVRGGISQSATRAERSSFGPTWTTVMTVARKQAAHNWDQGRRSWGRGPDPLKICRRGQSMFWHIYATDWEWDSIYLRQSGSDAAYFARLQKIALWSVTPSANETDPLLHVSS